MTEDQRREAKRDSLLLLCDLRSGTTEQQVKVRNLSSGGAMIDGLVGVNLGDAVSLNLRNIGWVEGIVAWILGDRSGISFLTTIDPQLPRRSIPTQDSTSRDPPPKPPKRPV
ncbi:MAG: PilZ domain-containing protein [Novosphingobium sp.]|nr:PilZ domain-containing protein [Novosphingobium sp.]